MEKAYRALGEELLLEGHGKEMGESKYLATSLTLNLVLVHYDLLP